MLNLFDFNQNLLLKLDPQTKGLMKNKSKEKKDEER